MSINFKRLALTALLVFSGCVVNAEDRLDMEGISIVGNSELPKALYIVPWQKPEERTSAGKPVNSLVDEILLPLEREVFLRRLKYWGMSR